MNIKTLNAHLKLLGPAPKGMKWKMYKNGEKFCAPFVAIDIPVKDGGGGSWRDDFPSYHANEIVNYTNNQYPHMRLWYLVPNKPKLKVVRIEVSGGVAECVSVPKGIKVVIYDHDNARDMDEGEKYKPDVTIG